MSTNLDNLDDAQLQSFWPSAASELRGFAVALDRGNAAITAAQLRLAVQMAERYYRDRLSRATESPPEPTP